MFDLQYHENQLQPSVDLHRDKQAIMSADVSYCKIRPYIKEIIPQKIKLKQELPRLLILTRHNPGNSQ